MDRINEVLQNLKCDGQDISTVSDGYHSFAELYEFRKVYNAKLFNEWAQQYQLPNFKKVNIPINAFDFNRGVTVKYDVHKSIRHYDGELCFGGGWFIVVAMLPTGQISNHYEMKDWDLFKIPAVEKAKYPFDGHSSQDVIDRLKIL